MQTVSLTSIVRTFHLSCSVSRHAGVEQFLDNLVLEICLHLLSAVSYCVVYFRLRLV